MIKLSFTLTLLILTLLTIPFSRTQDLYISRVNKDAPDHDRDTGGSKSYKTSSYSDIYLF